MSSGNTQTSTRATSSSRGTRLGLAGLNVFGVTTPLAAAVVTAWLLSADMVDGAHVAYVTVAAIAILCAVDGLVDEMTRDRYTRLHSRVYGSRTWACERCPVSITADRWTPGDAAAYEALISDPVAHRCTGTPQK